MGRENGSGRRACGSRRSDTLTASSFATSVGMRRRMNTGFPRHFTVTVCPGSIFPRSTSREASARTSAEAWGGAGEGGVRL